MPKLNVLFYDSLPGEERDVLHGHAKIMISKMFTAKYVHPNNVILNFKCQPCYLPRKQNDPNISFTCIQLDMTS